MPSAMDSGVCPKSSQNFLDGFFFLAVFQEPHELLWGEEKFAKTLAQHRLAHVLSRMGLPKRNHTWVAFRVNE